jgi:hypothetical protein
MQQLQVSIPKPCHEDWNTMSPKEQGRFCDKCCKTVVDFSDKSPEEVQQILQSRLHEKLCGRFRNDQLRKPVRLVISFSPFTTRMSAVQVFLVALLFTFGTTLFSCTTHQNERVGKITLEIPKIEKLSEGEYRTTGEVMVTPGIITRDIPKVKKLKHKVKAGVEARTDTSVVLPEVNVFAEKVPIVSCGHSKGAISTLGGIVISTAGVYIETMEADTSDRVAKVPEQNDLVVYPNPAQENVHVRLNLQNEATVQVELFDMSGKLVRTLISSREINPEETEFEFNISDLPPATYLLRIVESDVVQTKRLVVI